MLLNLKKPSILFSNFPCIGFLTPLYYEDPQLYWLPPFFKFCRFPPPRLQPPPLLLFWLLCFFEWMGHRDSYFLLNDIDLNMLSLGTLVTQDLVVSSTQKSARFLRSKGWRGVLRVLWFDITHIQTKTQHTQRLIDWHTLSTTCYVLTPAVCIASLNNHLCEHITNGVNTGCSAEKYIQLKLFLF